MVDPPAAPLPHIDRALVYFARLGARRPLRVLLCTLLVIALSAFTASHLEFREDFIDLLPSESVGARLLRGAMRAWAAAARRCSWWSTRPTPRPTGASSTRSSRSLRALPPTLVRTVEHGPEEIRRFFWQRRWLYAEVGDLEEISCELQRARRRAQPGYVDLDDEPCSALRSDHGRPAAQASTTAASEPAEPEPANVSAAARPFHHFRAQLHQRTREVDQYPTGYFRNPEGTLFAIVLRSPASGTGDRIGDQLMTRVSRIIRDVHPERFHPRAQVGLGGDIPNSIAERDALKAGGHQVLRPRGGAHPRR